MSHVRRRRLLLVGGPFLLASFACGAQQRAANVARIGFLGFTSASLPASIVRVEALRKGLRDLGYVEGRNISIEFRWADGRYERLVELAAELVRLQVDVIVAQGTEGGIAAKKATATTPIVIPAVANPVATGFVQSLARPGGNVTGLTWFSEEVTAKRLELIRTILPRSRKIAVVINPKNVSSPATLEAMRSTARSLNLEIEEFEIQDSAQLQACFAAIGQAHVDAITVLEDALLIANGKAIGERAMGLRIPVIAFDEVVEGGGLLAYGASFPDMFRRAAVYVDKIIKGAKASELPVERATKFDMAINLRAARALGITIPQSVLVLADRLVE